MIYSIEILERDIYSLETEEKRISDSKIPRLDQSENDCAIRKIRHRVELLRQSLIQLKTATEIDVL